MFGARQTSNPAWQSKGADVSWWPIVAVSTQRTDSEAYFVAGGTLPLQAHSYVEREADKALLKALQEGRFCYVLNSRQMGKSSLCVRTMARLDEQGVQTAFVDITKIGGRNVTPEQWYAGLLVEVGRSMNLKTEVLQYWKTEEHLSPMQRFFGALRDVVLEKIKGKVVIFIDEIDSTRSLSFNSDEFFAGVRECFNRRVQDPAYERLTFCFLGVAVPSDLIHDARTTPFNIGERIYLRDFTFDEAKPFAKSLGPQGEALFARVFHWTNGHPFLTQSLCRALALSGSQTSAEVDALIQRDLLEPKTRETNINLSDVGNRVLNGYADGDDIGKFRADILSAYDRALTGTEVLQDDESNRITAVLKLSGLMRSEGKALKVRNRIYESAFDHAWVKENMPGQELRRQRRAFILGAARTGLVSAAVIAVITYLAIANSELARKAQAVAKEKSYQAYVATMELMPVLYEQKNIARMKKLLTDHEKEPWKGVEWSFWDRMTHEAVAESPAMGQAPFFSPSPDWKEFVACDAGLLTFVDASTAQIKRTLNTKYDAIFAVYDSTGTKMILNFKGGGGAIIDPKDGHELTLFPGEFFALPGNRALIDSDTQVVGFLRNDIGALDLKTKAFRKIATNPVTASISQDYKEIDVVTANGPKNVVSVFDLSTHALKKQVPLDYAPIRAAALHDGVHILFGTASGDIAMFDMKTGQITSRLHVGDSPVNGFSLAADDTEMTVLVRNRAAALVSYRSGALQLSRWFPEANVAFIYPDKSRVATMYWNIKLYEPAQPPTVRVTSVGPGPWGQRFRRVDGKNYVTSRGSTFLVHEVRDGQVFGVASFDFPRNLDAVDPASFCGLANDGTNSTVRDYLAKKDLLSIKGVGEHPSLCKFGDRLAISMDGHRIDIYNLTTKASEASVKWPEKIRGILSDWQHRRLAIADESGSGGILNADGWKMIWNHPLHAQSILSGHFSRDGKCLVTCGDDDMARLWDVATGAKLQEFEGHAQSVTDIDITADGTRVLTVSDDETIRVWDTSTGLEITTFGQVGDGVNVCQVTEDGKFAVTANRAGEIKLWPITPR